MYTESITAKIEIKLFLCLIKHHVMMTYGGVKIQIFITLAPDGGECQLHLSAALPPEKKLTRWLRSGGRGG
jgi:hypothetical protein